MVLMGMNGIYYVWVLNEMVPEQTTIAQTDGICRERGNVGTWERGNVGMVILLQI